jgi:hypothetical protein
MNIEIALFDAFLAETYSINMALQKSQRTKTLNSGLIGVYNIVFFFHLSTILGDVLGDRPIPLYLGKRGTVGANVQVSC